MFFDITSIYFEDAGRETIGQNRFSKHHRPILKQMIVGMLLDNKGNPLCSEMWPGNVTDVKTLVPVIIAVLSHNHRTSNTTLAEIIIKRNIFIM